MNTIEAPEPNCIEILQPLMARLEAKGMLDSFQMMGGIGSAALQHAGTVILPNEKRLVTNRSFMDDNDDLNRIRPNGTVRDIDGLVFSSDQAHVDNVEAEIVDEIGDQLEVSMFSFKKGDYLEEQVANPLGFNALKTFVSDRYIKQDAGVVKALFPFEVTIHPQALERWVLEVGDQEFPVLNPAAAIVNYLTRSVTGLRPKDNNKVQTMTQQTRAKWPEMAEWINDGPGRSQMELAQILQTLRRANSWPKAARTLHVGQTLAIEAGAVRKLVDHEAFMLADSDSRTQQSSLVWATMKARGLGIPESNETLVKLFQMFAEKRVGSITFNR